MSKVKIKDYKEPQHLVLNALRLVGLELNYTSADLIHKTLEKVNELGDAFSIKDASIIKVEHEKEWDNYFQEQNTNKE